MKINIQKPNRLRILPLLCFVPALVAGVAAMASAKDKDIDAQAAKRKAEYIFLSGQQHEVNDDSEAYAAFLRAAAALDPRDDAIAIQNGLYDMMAGSMASDEVLERLERFCKNNPDDLYSARLYLNLAKHYDTPQRVADIARRLHARYADRTDITQDLVKALCQQYLTTLDTALWSEAMDLLKTEERGRGRQLGLVSQIVNLYLLRSDTTAALSCLDDLIADEPHNIDNRLYAANLYRSYHMDSLEIDQLHKAIVADPADGRPYLELANAYFGNKDTVQYRKYILQGLESPNIDFDDKYPLLQNLFGLAKYSDVSLGDSLVAGLFKTLEAQHDDDSRLHFIEGAYAMTNKDYAEGRRQFDFAVALDPENEDAAAALMHADMLCGDTLRMIKDGRAAMLHFKDDLYYPMQVMRACALTGQKDTMLAVINSVHIGPVRNPRAVAAYHATVGDMYHHFDMQDSAIAAYERAIALDDSDIGQYNNIAYFLSLAGRDLDRARRYAGYAVMVEPENGTFLDTYAWVAFKRQDYAEARKYIARALAATGLPYKEIGIDDDKDADGTDGQTPVSDNGTPGNDTTPGDQTGPDFDGDDGEGGKKHDLHDKELLDHAGDIMFMSLDLNAALFYWGLALEADPSDQKIKKKIDTRAIIFD